MFPAAYTTMTKERIETKAETSTERPSTCTSAGTPLKNRPSPEPLDVGLGEGDRLIEPNRRRCPAHSDGKPFACPFVRKAHERDKEGADEGHHPEKPGREHQCFNFLISDGFSVPYFRKTFTTIAMPTASTLVGDVLQSGHGADIRPGNALPLRYIPVGSVLHNVELRPGGGGKLARWRRHERAARGEGRSVRDPAVALHRDAALSRRLPLTLGEVGNSEAELISIGKAGRNRWLGVRPQTRGVAMNPVDHPAGGGDEGKTSGGRHPGLAVGQARGSQHVHARRSPMP